MQFGTPFDVQLFEYFKNYVACLFDTDSTTEHLKLQTGDAYIPHDGISTSSRKLKSSADPPILLCERE